MDNGLRYWAVRECFTTPQHVGIYGISRRVGQLEGEDVGSVDLELPDGVLGSGNGDSPRMVSSTYPRKDLQESGE